MTSRSLRQSKEEPSALDAIGIKFIRDWLKGMDRRKRRILGITAFLSTYVIGLLLLGFGAGERGVQWGRLLGAVIMMSVVVLVFVIAVLFFTFKYYYGNPRVKNNSIQESFKKTINRLF